MRIVGFMNAYTEGISGGDLRFIEVFKRFRGYEKVIITSELGKKLCMSEWLNAQFIVTTQERKFKHIFFTYLKRIVKASYAVMKLKGKFVLYSSSDFLPDILPALRWKLKNEKAKWIVCIYLIIPSLFKDYTKRFLPNNSFSFPGMKKVLYFLSQNLTIFFAKHWADIILVLNSVDKEFLVNKRGLDEKQVRVVRGGIAYKYITSLPEKDKIYDGVFLARFHPQKGIFDLIKIWKLVCEEKPGARLCVIGYGSRSFLKKVKEMIESYNLTDNIDLVGPKFGEEKFFLLKSSEVFVYPSWYESFAMAIAEAMACRLPVVTYDLPIYQDIYHNDILTVPIGDVNGFARVIIELFNNEDLREDLGKKACDFIKKYNWNQIAEEELDLINELLRRR